MSVPHKHAAVIKAWADGAEIQFKDISGNWRTLTARYAVWGDLDEYRVKPVPHKHQSMIDAFQAGKTIEVEYLPGLWGTVKEPNWTLQYNYRIKPEVVEHLFFAYANGKLTLPTTWQPGPNLKLSFEDGKLIKAEVL